MSGFALRVAALRTHLDFGHATPREDSDRARLAGFAGALRTSTPVRAAGRAAGQGCANINPGQGCAPVRAAPRSCRGLTDDVAVLVSGRLAAWRQPRDQRFATQAADTGGLAGLRIGLPLYGIEPYADLQVKSAGWVASEPNLGSGVTTLVGVAMPLFR